MSVPADVFLQWLIDSGNFAQYNQTGLPAVNAAANEAKPPDPLPEPLPAKPISEVVKEQALNNYAINNPSPSPSVSVASSVAVGSKVSEPVASPIANTPLVESGYWERTPTGPAPSTAEKALLPPSSGLPIFTGPLPSDNPVLIPTEGGGALVNKNYEVTNIEKTVTPAGVSTAYTVAPVLPKPDYGIAAQFTGGMSALLSVTGLAAELQFGKDSLATQLVKAEVNYGLSPLSNLAGGVFASVEAEAYGLANLANSVKVSAETGKLQYKPVNENLRLSPTVSGSAVSLLSGGEEAKAFSEMPLAYQIGAGLGEVGLFVVEGAAISKAVGYGVKTYKTVAPKINEIADTTFSKVGFKIYDKGYNVIEPAYQKFSRVSSALDIADSKVTAAFKNNVVLPAKLNIAEPVTSFASKTKQTITGSIKNSALAEEIAYQRAVTAPKLQESLAGSLNKIKQPLKSSALAEEISFQKSVVAPNLKVNLADYSLGLKGNRFTSEIKAYSQVLKAEKIKPVWAEGYKPSSITKELGKIGQDLKVTRGGASTDGQLTVQGLKSAYKQSKKLDRIPGLTIEESNPLKFATKQTQVTTQIMKNITKEVPKITAKTTSGLIFSGATKAVRTPYPGTARVMFKEVEETTYLTQPGVPLTINKPSLRTSDFSLINQQTKMASAEAVKLKPQFNDASIQLTPQITSKAKQASIPNVLQGVNQTGLSDVRQTLRASQTFAPRTVQKLNPRGFPKVDLGGGAGGGRGFDPLTGRWAVRKVPVKTFDKMLKTFGFNPSRQTVKSLNNLGRISKSKSGRKRRR